MSIICSFAFGNILDIAPVLIIALIGPLELEGKMEFMRIDLRANLF
jgi:hypothetical protein